MARIPLGALTTLNTALHFDPMFTEIYSGAFAGFAFANNRLGIGRAPSYAVDVYGTGVASVVSVQSSDASGAQTFMQSNSNVDGRFGTLSNHPLLLMVNGAEGARLTATGFGIGVQPSFKLDVFGTNIAIRNATYTGYIGDASNLTFGGVNTELAIRSLNGDIVFATNNGNIRLRVGAGPVTPGADNGQTLGSASFRWSTVFAGTGAINTSDAREKTAVEVLADAELEAAIELAREIGSFQFLASIAEKGEEAARIHIGLTVQRAIEVMEAHGLEPMRYAFICHDKWDEKVVPARVRIEKRDTGLLDANGQPIVEEIRVEVEPEKVVPPGDRYGFRYDQLAMFLLRGQDERLRRLEARP